MGHDVGGLSVIQWWRVLGGWLIVGGVIFVRILCGG